MRGGGKRHDIAWLEVECHQIKPFEMGQGCCKLEADFPHVAHAECAIVLLQNVLLKRPLSKLEHKMKTTT